MRVFNAWNGELRRATDNQLSLRFYPGGVAGDEADFIRKIRAGQMDGAAVTTTGLGQIVRPVLVLTVPGLFQQYRQLDRARNALSDELNGLFEENGYVNLGWGDVGRARIFSTEAIRRPQDLRSSRPWAWREDVVFSQFLSTVGANPVRLGVPEVYPALQTGQVNAVPASALAAVSLQWHTRFTHVTQQTSSVIIGATILRKETFDGLSEAHQTALTETANRAHALLSRAIRRDDDRAYDAILERGVTAVDTDPHRSEWESAGRQTREALVGRLYSRELLNRVTRAAGN
jgi:TRAP-type C4-dicarboxylate transport system substrate-binding protein